MLNRENKFTPNTRDKFPDSRGLVVGSAEQRHRSANIARFAQRGKKEKDHWGWLVAPLYCCSFRGPTCSCLFNFYKNNVGRWICSHGITQIQKKVWRQKVSQSISTGPSVGPYLRWTFQNHLNFNALGKNIATSKNKLIQTTCYFS